MKAKSILVVVLLVSSVFSGVIINTPKTRAATHDCGTIIPGGDAIEYTFGKNEGDYYEWSAGVMKDWGYLCYLRNDDSKDILYFYVMDGNTELCYGWKYRDRMG